MFLTSWRRVASCAAQLIAVVMIVGVARVEHAGAQGQGQNQGQNQGQSQQQQPQQQQPQEQKKEPTPQQKAYSKLLDLTSKASKANTDFIVGGCGDGDKEKMAKLKQAADSANGALDKAIDEYLDKYPTEQLKEDLEAIENTPGVATEKAAREIYREHKKEEHVRVKEALSEGKPLSLGMTPECSSFASASGLPPLVVEASVYGGLVAASSFGSNFSPDVGGARAALSLRFGQFGWQTDVQGEQTSDYSGIAGYRSYIAGGTHFDWMWMPGGEIGAIGGLQDATPTFFGQENTNYFVGLEGRQFFGPAMIGAQAGYFNDVSGPGTLINAGFAEGRFKFSVGNAFGVPALRYTIAGVNVGYASGTDSATATGAQTTSWGAGLSQGIANTPFSVFFDYRHFNNHVDGVGTVWNENTFTVGVKLLWPSTDRTQAWTEPTRPLPVFLSAVTNF